MMTHWDKIAALVNPPFSLQNVKILENNIKMFSADAIDGNFGVC